MSIPNAYTAEYSATPHARMRVCFANIVIEYMIINAALYIQTHENKL